MKCSYLLLIAWALQFLLAACSKSNNNSSSAAFVKVFTADTSYQAGGSFQLPDGNFIVYGFTPEELNVPPVVIKTDVNGNLIWQKTLPVDFHYCTMKPTLWGTMIAVGIPNATATSLYICETDPDLNVITGPQEYPLDIIKSGPLLTPKFIIDGQELVIAITALKNNIQLPLILRIDATWSAEPYKTFDLGNGVDLMVKGICLDENGFTIVGCSIYEPNNPGPPVISFSLRLDSSLNELWHTTISSTQESISTIGVSDANSSSSVIAVGSIYAEGNWKNSAISDMGGTLYSQSVNSQGTLSGQNLYTNYENFAHGCDLQKTFDGGFVLLATTNELSDGHLISDYRIYLLKLDSALREEWHVEFNGFNAFTAVSVTQTMDGGYLLSGYEHSGTYHFDMCLIKTDANGNIANQ